MARNGLRGGGGGGVGAAGARPRHARCGRIGRRALGGGRYHLTVRATDGAGNGSAARAPEVDTRTSSLGLPRLHDSTAVA